MLKFPLGQCVMTSSANASVHREDMIEAIIRHGKGDWGALCEADRLANEHSLAVGGRLFSVYFDRNHVKFYIITEWDRSATTVLLPEDY